MAAGVASTDTRRSRWRSSSSSGRPASVDTWSSRPPMVEARGDGLLGIGRFGPAYWQDHATVHDATSVAGHAVRQLYLDCGAVDVATELGDRRSSMRSCVAGVTWSTTRMYLTGGLGSRHRDEAFGDPFELPPDRAYAETCAAIAGVMLAWRLYLATGRPRLRGRHRADSLQRRAARTLARWHGLLLRQHAAAQDGPRRRGRPATGLASHGSPVPAARRTSCASSARGRSTSRPRTTMASSFTSSPRPRWSRRSRVARSVSPSSPTTHGTDVSW